MGALPASWKTRIREAELTGLWRPRVQAWTGAIVIQVQLKGVMYDVMHGTRIEDTTWWRDATLNDLMALGLATQSNVIGEKARPIPA